MMHPKKGVIVSFVFGSRGRLWTAKELQLHPFLCPKTTTIMKQAVLSTIFLLLILRAPAQTQIYNMRVFEDCIGDPISHNATDCQSVNILTSLYYNKLTNNFTKFKIYSEREQTFEVISSQPEQTTKDDDEQLLTCIDQDGVKCKVFLDVFKNATTDYIAALLIYYQDVELYFKLKKD